MRIFVGEGSRSNGDKCLECAARSIGEFIASKGHTYVFDGHNTGLMGLTYREVLKNPDCKIYAVVSKAYEEKLKEMDFHIAHVLEPLHLRKDSIAKLADVMVFLPGGISTINELMTAIEMVRTGEYEGRVFIVNINGFFDSLIRQLGLARWNNFSEDIDRYCRIFPNVREAILYLESME
jgi:hypothetical protein